MVVQRRAAPPDQSLTSINELLNLLEERNLRGQRHVDRALRQWVRNLGVASEVAVPRGLLRARNTARLHEALLDWMETALYGPFPDDPDDYAPADDAGVDAGVDAANE